ncbi:MAG: nitrite/sulfite reductase, partial [Gammaproteobacteria bacterium]|nr:nitrite/sulfite reductase [Gammaproteobacteria bacterium]NIO63399.1 nitrite/sulfite reductase [Gammaproteobacteria bacterium]
APAVPPGDATDKQMDFIADLSDQYSYGEIVVTHDQNLVLPHIKQADMYDLWQALKSQELATPNIGLLTDMICCPGLD